MVMKIVHSIRSAQSDYNLPKSSKPNGKFELIRVFFAPSIEIVDTNVLFDVTIQRSFVARIITFRLTWMIIKQQSKR